MTETTKPPEPIDFLYPQVKALMESLTDILQKANYPVTQASTGVLVAVGVAHMRGIGISEHDIAILLMSLIRTSHLTGMP